MATHDDEIGRARRVGDQRDLNVGIRIERACQRIDGQESVGLGKRRHRARTFAGRKRDCTVFAGDERDQHEFLAAELRSYSHRHARRRRSCRFRRQARRARE